MAKADETDVLCETIKRLAAAAKEAGVAHLSVTAPLVGKIDLTLAPPAVTPLPRNMSPLASAGPRKGPASRLAEFHAKQQQHKHDVLFAASSVKPTFTQPEPPRSTVPRAERDRRAAARGNEENGG